MLEDMQIRNLSSHTQRAYVENVARFARYFGRSPADLGPDVRSDIEISGRSVELPSSGNCECVGARRKRDDVSSGERICLLNRRPQGAERANRRAQPVARRDIDEVERTVDDEGCPEGGNGRD
jgi:hypothetical protein